MELFTCWKILVWKNDPRKEGGQVCLLSVIYCVIFFISVRFSGISLSQWRDARDAMIGQFKFY